ncbi:FtsX-like permease family protein [Opitutaceae bacterium TAV4]|uniref:ABC transporter permease n=1 Tax=Geminisphaera colitermitum TaxID=1148786 RepID=UPI000158CA18|nr:ABC transporter permease [Geminisphaera colitermitum]RRJ95960.1 FtsX-like permease family protein [Opitutaceae bacterium TAV4]RRJ96068.1 FtsX-like permease family protein [Opitutaceae bacterium TAV4]RRK00207.1 FtsX-like permease family protein [Opitutaceae bacterium TAV3]
MRFIATTLIALRALRRNKLRSFLTALGIIIGVAAVIAMVSIGNGAKAQVEAQVASLGRNVITVFPGSVTSAGVRTGWGSASTLTPEDAQAIQREVPGVVSVSPEVRDRQQVLANGLNWNTLVQGESPDFLSVRAWGMAEGAIFAETDVRSAAKVCIIGSTVAEQLFPDSNPVGQTLRIRNIPMRILGVLESKGYNAMMNQDQDDIIIVPYTTSMRRISRRTYLSSILVEAASAEQMPIIQEDITALLTQRRGGREPDFTVRNQLELAERATETSRTMTALLGSIAGVSLMVGGIGIMNIMLVSVTERTREIGIRLAIGAHDQDIRLQFLIEAMILSVLGGLLGVALGIGISQLVSHLKGWPILVSMDSITLAVVFSATVGIAFGFYPAHKAAQLDPIEALRYE